MKRLILITTLIALTAMLLGCSASERWGGTFYCEGLNVDGNALISGDLIVEGDLTVLGNLSAGNIAIGNITMAAGANSTIVTHRLSSVPTCILLNWAGDPGNDAVLRWDSADDTYFTINVTTDNITNETLISWLAIVGDL